ncbi:hypothetical protein BJF80_09465 [Serinicoccus sp. CUA-874]|uniref:hypothetical protein n=1 Tax=Serinicoccus sp. CUA-874 TaxID=1517939 RepID=UPI000960D226|nr:hypothetical protein [Serinicoccus sp. CUA-874]OLT15612.1 hypothetical protein BJF80_09465 [Serinicoccus sp. CUA-874]
MTHLGDEERRRRIAVRHGLHPQHRYADALACARGIAALHATDASTVDLALAARVEGSTPGRWLGDVEPDLRAFGPATGALAAEAGRLTDWLAGRVVTNVYAAKQAAGRVLG